MDLFVAETSQQPMTWLKVPPHCNRYKRLTVIKDFSYIICVSWCLCLL